MDGPVESVTLAALAAGLVDRARSGQAARPAVVPDDGATPKVPTIIAIDGWSGSGKTHLAGQLAPALGAPCVHVDDFVPGWEGLAASVDLLAEWILAPLSSGREARWQCWDWTADRWSPDRETLPPADVVLVEGCGSGSAVVRPWLSALVWMDTAADERARRLRARADWPLYQPSARLWTRQEQALRAGDDPSSVATVLVRAGPTEEGEVGVVWRPGASSALT